MMFSSSLALAASYDSRMPPLSAVFSPSVSVSINMDIFSESYAFFTATKASYSPTRSAARASNAFASSSVHSTPNREENRQRPYLQLGSR